MNINSNPTPYPYVPIDSGHATPTQATFSSQSNNTPVHRLHGPSTKELLDEGCRIGRADLGIGRDFESRRTYQTKLSQSSGNSRIEVAQLVRKNWDQVEIQSHEFLSTPNGTELRIATNGDVPTLRRGIYENNQFSKSVMDEINNAVGKHDRDV